MTLDSLNGWHSHLAEVYQHFKNSTNSSEHDLHRGLDNHRKFTAQKFTEQYGEYILPGNPSTPAWVHMFTLE